MKLTQYTDYALRVMIHLAAHPDRLVSIRQIAEAYTISQNHLMKVVHDLGRAGFVTTLRGRNGGLRLARPAEEISIGAIVRHTEGHGLPVNCNGCLIAPACGLPSVLVEAMEAFMTVLDRYRLHELARQPEHMRRLFGLPDPV
jgi:Rrf2 family transcriptional regulator, nitric oxide-sensitive transcriptional repressor